MNECDNCESKIRPYATVITIFLKPLEDKSYCCKKCAIEAIQDYAEEIYEEYAEEAEEEDPDPYSRYGVSRNDF